MVLIEQTIIPSECPLSEATQAFLTEGRSRFSSVDCFEFVHSDYKLAR